MPRRHHQIGEREAEAAERHLADGQGLGAALALPRPQPHDQRREHKNHQRIEGEEPGRGDFALPENQIDRAVGEVLGPKQDGVALLVVGGPEQRHQGADADEREHDAALAGIERLLLAARPPSPAASCRPAAIDAAVQIDAEAHQHADARRGEAVVPAVLDGERAADQRRQECPDIDADIEDRIGAVAPVIPGG